MWDTGAAYWCRKGGRKADRSPERQAGQQSKKAGTRRLRRHNRRVLWLKCVHLFVGGDRDPEAAAWCQSDVHQNRGETEDGQDGRWLGPEVERRTAVKKKNNPSVRTCLTLSVRLSVSLSPVLFSPFVLPFISVISRPLCSTITLVISITSRLVLPKQSWIFIRTNRKRTQSEASS